MANTPSEPSNVLVRACGIIGFGKSSTLNAIAGYNKQLFACGASAQGIKVNMDAKVSVNPEVFKDAKYLLLADSEGIGSSAEDSVAVVDRLLARLKTEPATLMIVNRFGRVDLSLVRFLQLLGRCSSLSSDNCVLVLTFAADRDLEQDSSMADPTAWIEEVQHKAGVSCFVKEKNVVCMDFDEHRKTNVNHIRETLITKNAVRAHMTYSELLQATEGGRNDCEKARQIARDQLEGKRYDLAWHERRIEDLTLAVKSTCWIPFVGQISAAGMLIAIADSKAKVKRLSNEISDLDAVVQNAQLSREKLDKEVEFLKNALQ